MRQKSHSRYTHRLSPTKVTRARKGNRELLPFPPPAIELALRGLCNLGFAQNDALRAVDHLARRRIENGDALDVHDLLRGAIAALT
jgi:hypothetical protein